MIIEIPTTTRLFIDENASEEEIQAIIKECMMGDFALIEESDSSDFEKKIKEYVDIDSSGLSGLIKSIDFWADLNRKPQVTTKQSF
ncbi:hypothetical protein M3914_003164 [Vibrio metschnikovii]|nr:hypothetical protein [Vibrio metschnikovii]